MKRASILTVMILLPVLSASALSPNLARQMGDAIADAVERVMPSVVVIRTEATVYRMTPDLFFGHTYGIPDKLAGQGSGVIITEDGYILTSHHVVDRAQEIEVVLHDGTKYPATLVGRDPQTDLAVVRISAPEGVAFQPIEAADSDAVRVGEMAIAVGSPFSLMSSVTVGIVSQKGRSVGVLPYEDFIQTDASINPGNSGGPLVDADGRMIGLNAVIQTAGPYSQGNIGIGFAVPANLAMDVADSLIRTGAVERAWIGILPQELETAMASKLLGSGKGLYVARILDNTPASRSALLQGDIITAVDTQPVGTVRELQRAILKRRIGDEVALTVRRGAKEVQIRLATEKMPTLEMLRSQP
ncbi:MAG: trypsin-like peptidase domain-containing protein [Kiritimatiellae bacterium]|nr:trypsin-like peptidase domain-containing protein [Kiritimatiellia bacterium]